MQQHVYIVQAKKIEDACVPLVEGSLPLDKLIIEVPPSGERKSSTK